MFRSMDRLKVIGSMTKGVNEEGWTSWRVLFENDTITVVSKIYLHNTKDMMFGGVKLFLNSDFERTSKHWSTQDRRTRIETPERVIEWGRTQIDLLMMLLEGGVI